MSAAADVQHDLRAYYARRAAEYERLYHRPERQAELRAIETWLAQALAGRRVLELACGTGWWTPHGARHALAWLATDINPETLAVARGKALPACVRLGLLDAETLQGLDDEPFDAAFAGCWWSHVARQDLPGWLERLHARLQPGARLVFIDNTWVPGRSTPIARRDAQGNGYQLRRLDDGSTHEVLKNYPSRDEVLSLLGGQVRDVQWIEHPHQWVLRYDLA